MWLLDKWWLPGVSAVSSALAKRTTCVKEAALGRAFLVDDSLGVVTGIH